MTTDAMTPEIIERAHALIKYQEKQWLILADSLEQRAHNIPGGVHVAGVHVALARAAIQKPNPDVHLFFSNVALAERSILERETAIATVAADNLFNALKERTNGKQ